MVDDALRLKLEEGANEAVALCNSEATIVLSGSHLLLLTALRCCAYLVGPDLVIDVPHCEVRQTVAPVVGVLVQKVLTVNQLTERKPLSVNEELDLPVAATQLNLMPFVISVVIYHVNFFLCVGWLDIGCFCVERAKDIGPLDCSARS
ncbi:hypothetical protein ACWEPM_24065 [Streptomyces sp. NPDC004244]